MSYRTLTLKTVAALFLATASSLAVAAPTPFTAQYQLDISGWPDATITHQLSNQGDVWKSDMRTSIKIASGEEWGRFRLDGDDVQALEYASSYSLVGIGDDYHLDQAQLSELPDRQTAIFDLSRKAPSARCANPQVSPCKLVYLSHKGEEKTLLYRVTEKGDITTPAGTFPGVTVDTWDPEKRKRHLFMTFHQQIPDLLLKMRYVRDDEERSHLVLTKLTLPEGESGEAAPEAR